MAGILNKVYYPCYNGSVLVVIKVKPRFTDTHLIRTPHYYGQFALSLGKESPYIFSKFNPVNTDTSLLRTVWFVPGERKPLHFL